MKPQPRQLVATMPWRDRTTPGWPWRLAQYWRTTLPSGVVLHSTTPGLKRLEDSYEISAGCLPDAREVLEAWVPYARLVARTGHDPLRAIPTGPPKAPAAPYAVRGGLAPWTVCMTQRKTGIVVRGKRTGRRYAKATRGRAQPYVRRYGVVPWVNGSWIPGAELPAYVRGLLAIDQRSRSAAFDSIPALTTYLMSRDSGIRAPHDIQLDPHKTTLRRAFMIVWVPIKVRYRLTPRRATKRQLESRRKARQRKAANKLLIQLFKQLKGV